MDDADAQTAPIVEGRNLHKVYELRNTQVEAVRGVDLEIYPAEFISIMGPSGCGKSTLLNLLAGLDEPTEGEVLVAGQRLATLTEAERAILRRHGVGFIFQSYDLLALLTVVQNVEIPLALAGVRAEERRNRALDMLSRVGLLEKADALPDELSGGQKQRVAIARTLITEPDVIFADEPTGSLDRITGSGILSLLRQAVDEGGAAVVMVTHDEDDAGIADRIVRLRDGRVSVPEAA